MVSIVYGVSCWLHKFIEGYISYINATTIKKIHCEGSVA